MLAPDADDDPLFLEEIRPIIEGALRCYVPAELYLVKIDNWFDSKWAWFGGKVLGALGVHAFSKLVIPPFVPNRVIHQKYYERLEESAEQYFEREAKPIHIEQTSSNNFGRVLKQQYSSVVFVWYSGDTKSNQRGSLMLYWVKDDMAWGWHAAFVVKNRWKLGETTWIPRLDVLNMAAL